MQISSSAFSDGDPIPRKYTEDGANISPPLQWAGVPNKAQSLAVIVDDPDAPREKPWVHWVAYNIPADTGQLPEGVPRDGQLDHPVQCVQGINSWGPGEFGYRGPAPPRGHGTHHYHFHVLALDRRLDLGPGVEREGLEQAISRAKVLDRAKIIGTYERSG